jgi:hypothetical protein
MDAGVYRCRVAIGVTAIVAATVAAALAPARAAKVAGRYATGDFHNHTTCTDGSISLQKLLSRATASPWALDWFVQSGHGGGFSRNCTLAEDEALATPAYPLTYSSATPPVLQGPGTSWQNTNPAIQPKGLASGTAPNQNMWRWQTIQEFQYPLMEYLSAYRDVPLFMGLETNVPGHEHLSISVITGQMPAALDTRVLPQTRGYQPLGNADALAQWEYCFDRADADVGRGNTIVGSLPIAGGNNWDCSVHGSANALDPQWSALGQKLIVAGGAGTGTRGHSKALESLKWLAQQHANASYYIPAHVERAGPFQPNGNNGYNVEHLRDFNNTAPDIAFGFEAQPGHHASDIRGEFSIRRNNVGSANVDSVGGTTWGGTGVYGAQIGGVWDALLGEGRRYWFFASSDWHNRGIFGPDDRRSTQDFFPGEYQQTFVMARNGTDPRLRPQAIVDGLRSGNAFVVTGQLIDRLAFVACADYPVHATSQPDPAIKQAAVEALAVAAAFGNTDVDAKDCATMGEKLTVRPGSDIVISIVVRDPAGSNHAPYTFDNPSLAQIGMRQPLNRPVLDHVDVIGGLVSGFRQPGTAAYAGQWPNDWIRNPSLAGVPAAAKNPSAALVRTFNASTWRSHAGLPEFKLMTFRIANARHSQYVRLRGTNLPPSVPFETDSFGNPLADLWTNVDAVQPSVPGGSDGAPAGHYLRIPCTAVGTNVPATGAPYGGTAIDGCPHHLPVKSGVKYVAYDVAGWSDLWFYSNPIYIEVMRSVPIAGVR